MARRGGEHDTGAFLLGAAEGLRESAGTVRPGDETPWVLEEAAAMRAELGDEAYAAALARGRRLGAADAVAAALDATG